MFNVSNVLICIGRTLKGWSSMSEPSPLWMEWLESLAVDLKGVLFTLQAVGEEVRWEELLCSSSNVLHVFFIRYLAMEGPFTLYTS